MPAVKCVYCKKYFFKSDSRVNEARKFKWNFYCSKDCLSNHHKRRKFVVCENSNCSKTFEKLISAIETHNYCSSACAATVNNRKFPKRGPGFKICKLCDKHFGGVNLYCSEKCAKDGRRGYTPEELLEEIKLISKKKGRVPARREVSRLEGLCRRVYGSWTAAVLAAGLTPNRSHEHRMYKRTRTKAKDGCLCDSVSEAIIDNWLTDNGIKHKRDFAYPKSNHKADWAINKKTFIEYFGLAKDSPRYDRDIKTKRNLCKKLGINLVALYPSDLYPKLKLAVKLGNLLN